MSKDGLREHAFDVWYQSGGSLARALAKLTSEGYIVTRQTLALWREDGEWTARAHRLDIEKQAARDALMLTEDEQLLASLKRQQDKYESYFDMLPKPDTQATYAHNGLIKTIQEVAQKTAGYKRAVFAEYFKSMLAFFRLNKPPLAEALEAETESYLAYIKENV